MTEVVDSIIADLDIRYQKYVDGFSKATSAVTKHTRAVERLVAVDRQSGDLGKSSVASLAAIGKAAEASGEVRKRAAKGASDAEKAEAKGAAEAVKVAAREKAAAERAAAKAAADAVKAAEREKQAALKATQLEQDKAAQAATVAAEAQRVAAAAAIAAAEQEAAARERLSAVAQRAVDRQRAGVAPAVNSRIGSEVPREVTGQRGIPANVLGADATAGEVTAEKEINHLLADRFDLAQKARVAEGSVKRELTDQMEYLRRIDTYKRAGLADDEATIRAEGELLAIERLRADTARKQATQGTEKFLQGAGLGRTGGGAAAIGGIAAAGAAAFIYGAAKDGLEYAASLKAVSDQLGVTTKTLQVFETAGERVGVTTEQLRESLGQVSNNLGRAQLGGEEQSKIFAALNIDVGNAKDGYKSLGDLLPTIADRLSKVQDQTKRNAYETALGGEQLRKLDPILSQGSAGLDALSDSLERTGGILSGEEINRSAKVAADLKRLGDQLERQLASTVSQNAAAIETLATSLLNGASALLRFIDAFQRFRAQNKIDTGVPSLVAEGRASLNQSATGRQQLFRENSDSLRALRMGARNPAQPFINVGAGIGTPDIFGRTLVANTPAARAAAKKQLLEQRRETLAANGAADAVNGGAGPAVQVGDPNLNAKPFAPKPPKGAKGKSADAIEAERLEREKRFTSEEAQAQIARLGYLADLTSDTRQQDEYARDRIRIEQEARDKEFRDQAEATISRQNLKGPAAALERSRAEQLVKENDANAELALQVINRHELSRYLDEELAHAQTAADIRLDDLNTQSTLADTAKERVALEKRILAITIESERLALQRQIDDKATTPEARADAETRLNSLPGKQRNGEALIDDRNRNPVDQFRRSLNDPATQVQQAVADKLKAVDQSIADAAARTLGVKDPFLKSLLQIFLEQNVLKPLYNALAKAQGGKGGIFGAIISGVTAVFSKGSGGASSVGAHSVGGGGYGGLSGLASGGHAVGGNSYLVGESGPEVVSFKTSGKVYPNGSLPTIAAAAGGSTVIHAPQFNLRGAIVTRELYADMERISQHSAATAGKAAYTQAVKDAPAAVARARRFGS